MFGMQGSISSSAQRNAGTAGDVGAGYGSGASNINAQLMPFLTRELNAPQGYTQQQTGSMLNQAEAGAGGATAGLRTNLSFCLLMQRRCGFLRTPGYSDVNE